ARPAQGAIEYHPAEFLDDLREAGIVALFGEAG
ncbi:unnamed protein product, partial [marine sediment metagenome]